jgi:hypothetical protein
MPVLRYFVFVGAALLALLFVVAEAFPTSPLAQVASITGTKAADLSVIRIHSDRKWPDRVVFETGVQTSAPAAVAAVVPASTQAAKNEAYNTAVSEAGTKVTAQDAFAQLAPSDLKKMDPKLQQKRKVAKKHVAPPPMQLAQRPQFGLFANNIW